MGFTDGRERAECARPAKHIDHAPGEGDDKCAYCVRYRAVRELQP